MKKRGEGKTARRNITKNSRGAMDISFGLIFAIIAGIFILALAIFAATKLKDIETSAAEGETSKTISILMNPLESSFESSKRIAITSSIRTRIYTSCEIDEKDIFGNQIIQTSQLVYGKWNEPELNIKFANKYIFSEYPVEGKKFYVFSEPLEFPFKVSDLIYITSSEKNYCFLDASNEIEEDLEYIQQANMLLENCPEESVNICFGKNEASCDIKVSYSSGGSGYVLKDGKKMYFEEKALMYAAIFSNQQTYECQVKRLINRTKVLNEIYINKNNKMSQEINCGNEIKGDLIIFNNLLKDFTDSGDLSILKSSSEDLYYKNYYGECPLW